MEQNVHATLLVEIGERVKQSNPAVKESIVIALSTEEIEERKSLAKKAFLAISELHKQMKKLNPDLVNIQEDGTETKSYSKQKFDEKKKHQEKIDKIERVFVEAIDPELGDKDKWNKLKEEVGKLKDSGQ